MNNKGVIDKGEQMFCDGFHVKLSKFPQAVPSSSS